MFNGRFVEAEDQTVTLSEMRGVVSARSFEAFLQWLYLGRVKFNIEDPKDHISALIELARLLDMLYISETKLDLAGRIKELLVSNPGCETDTNTHLLTKENIISAIQLPCGDPIRSVLAAASVEGFLTLTTCKFAKLMQQHPAYGSDLLQEVKGVFDAVHAHRYLIRDPIRGDQFRIPPPIERRSYVEVEAVQR
jgi:hypothetical protein